MSSPISRPSTFLRLTPDVPFTAARPVSSFLSLAPEQSPSYPQMPVTRQLTEGQTEPAAEVPSPPQRRKSSEGSSNRILKLGPVHWGVHLEDHKDDFHDVPSSP